MSNTNDIRAYQQIVDAGILPEIQASGHPYVCLFHLLLKALPLTLFLLYSSLQNLFGQMTLNQLIIFLIVVDFWYTKNVAGRRLAGLRWWLEEDDNEIERLKVECRVNQDEYTNKIISKVFWGIQGVYVVAALVFLVINTVMFNFKNVVLTGAMFVEGAINLYCFIRSSRIQTQRVLALQSKLGLQFTRKLFAGSLISFT